MSLTCRLTGGGNRGNPGPADYKIKSKIGEAPQYTIKDRHEIPDRVNTAGYLNFPSTVGQGKKYSLSGRHREISDMNTPGPNYVPPNFGSEAKKSTLHIRDNGIADERLNFPGPGAYSLTPRIAGSDSLKYSLRSRTGKDAADPSPGPAAYLPDFSRVQKKSPSPTMHIRPPDAKKDATPGPSDYNIDRDMKGAKATMHVRPRGLSVDNNPGPGAYTPNHENYRSNPRFATIKGRHEEVDHRIDVGYLNLRTTIGEGPKAALSSRHRELQQMQTPGPAYVPPGLGVDSRKNSMHFRTTDLPDDRLRNPGPGAYDSAPKFGRESLKYSMRGRTADLTRDVSPGPAAYTPDFGATRKAAPKATMHIRPREPEKQQTPGYLRLPSTFNGPRYSIGQRDSMDMILM